MLISAKQRLTAIRKAAAESSDFELRRFRVGKERLIKQGRKPSKLKATILIERLAKKEIIAEARRTNKGDDKSSNQGDEGEEREEEEDGEWTDDSDQDDAADDVSRARIQATKAKILSAIRSQPVALPPSESPVCHGVPGSSPAPSAPRLRGRGSHHLYVRDYVRQELSDALNKKVESLLQELARFQQRAKTDNPQRFSKLKRYVAGMSESERAIKEDRAKALVVAPNVEPSVSAGGLDDMMQSLLAECEQRNVPVIFALSRNLLGRAIGKNMRQSAVCIVSAEGAHQLLKESIQMANEQRDAFERKSRASDATTDAGCASTPAVRVHYPLTEEHEQPDEADMTPEQLAAMERRREHNRRKREKRKEKRRSEAAAATAVADNKTEPAPPPCPQAPRTPTPTMSEARPPRPSASSSSVGTRPSQPSSLVDSSRSLLLNMYSSQLSRRGRKMIKRIEYKQQKERERLAAEAESGPTGEGRQSRKRTRRKTKRAAGACEGGEWDEEVDDQESGQHGREAHESATAPGPPVLRHENGPASRGRSGGVVRSAWDAGPPCLPPKPPSAPAVTARGAKAPFAPGRPPSLPSTSWPSLMSQDTCSDWKPSHASSRTPASAWTKDTAPRDDKPTAGPAQPPPSRHTLANRADDLSATSEAISTTSMPASVSSDGPIILPPPKCGVPFPGGGGQRGRGAGRGRGRGRASRGWDG
ncbi:unnamed protein product [Vitrella brassicaformis CCMP3155]|uniref:Ribosomal protein eL8/eL30/eS12/Gadd45 domain-containing protein n=1 Tax=Vitrella brassicaformis (strain CCMP3155) TaxID=1169540 RepID=A0A0G4EUK3_VITBC|nr:unnamed protein product [Vitrella brassicaformis CCMP3155]|eukprot:CEM02113.1 unnamed protein product [Vitrella brassicaformis CCMP3155]